MTQWAIIYPLLAQVALTFVLMFWMASRRIASLRDRKTKIPDIALAQHAWPDDVQRISNAYHNQFELPILFYAACIIALVAGKVSSLFILLAWIYVAARIAHAWIYTTTNNIKHRFSIFAAGAIVLIAMWLILGLGIIVDGT